MKIRTNISSSDLNGSDNMKHTQAGRFFKNINDEMKGATVSAGFS
jgi:hypothetical protein